MTAPLVSVIIPVYDGERSIRGCLHSVASQSYRRLEIIVVNDGSADATEDIVRELRDEDPRIELIVQDNRGVSAARNRGLAAASGEWVMFVDADDAFADPALVEAVVSVGAGAELVTFGVRSEEVSDVADHGGAGGRRRVADAVSLLAQHAQDIELEPRAVAEMILDERANALWDKAYRHSLITEQRARFCEGIRMGEDLLFNLACLPGARRMRVLPIDGYLYRRGSAASATQRYLPDKFSDLMYVNEQLRAWARTTGSRRLIGAGEYIRAKNVFSCMRDLHHRDCELPAGQRLSAAREFRAKVPVVGTRGLKGRRRMLCLAYNLIGSRPMFHIARLTGALR